MQDAAATTALVELRDISKHFGGGETRVDALREVTLSVGAGEVVGLLGPSGSGKSTLLNVVGAIVEPNEGWMRLDGEVVYEHRWLRHDLRRLRLEKIGFIFQYHNLLPFLDSTDNVALVLHLAGCPKDDSKRRAIDLLEYLQVGHRKHAMPAQLSGGEAQRVAIARALANRPRIILADEPTAALDSERAGIVMDLLRQLAAEQQAAIIAVTHDEKIIGRFDRIFRLRDGCLESTEESAAGRGGAEAGSSGTAESARASRAGARFDGSAPLR
jgi:putative ABC transport system ATP-binding protein